ncbi:hypothetical protein D3C78_1886440 [compost metagenome]
MQDQVARYLKQDIADKEQPGAQAEGRFAQLQLVGHLQLGQPDIDAVEVGGQIAQTEERDQPPGDFAVQKRFCARFPG